MNNLGITKEEGRAALRELEYGFVHEAVTVGLRKIGWECHLSNMDELATAVALIASISGVVDAKGNPK